jgi:rhodanese-related sulfurtransferase
MAIVIVIIILAIIYYFVRRYMLAKDISHYNPKEADARVRSGSSVFLDVREPGERTYSKIKNSFHIPLKELPKRLNELERYKEKEIICYCATGNRSLKAASFLHKNGFDAANLRGGMAAWKRLR